MNSFSFDFHQNVTVTVSGHKYFHKHFAGASVDYFAVVNILKNAVVLF